MEAQERDEGLGNLLVLGWAIEVLALGEIERSAAHRRCVVDTTEENAWASHETMVFTWRMAMRARAALAHLPSDGTLAATCAATLALLDATVRYWKREGMMMVAVLDGRSSDEVREIHESADAPDDITPERQALAVAIADLAREDPDSWTLLALRDETLEVLASVMDLPPAGDAYAA